MKQFTYKIGSREELLKWADMIKASDDYKSAKEVLFKVTTNQIKDEDSKNFHRELKRQFPKAKIAGLSMSNFMRDLQDKDDSDAISTALLETGIISCLYFDSAKLTIWEIDGSNIDNIAVKALECNAALRKIPDLKGVEVLCTSGNTDYATFLEIVTEGLEDIPFFGACAGLIDVSKLICQYHNIIKALKGVGVTQYITGDDYHNDGIVFIAYSGADLHIKADYNLGWKPLGKEMTITETLGVNGLATIDNIPAIEIYKKYLNVEPNEFLMFNVFEFPFILNRGGVPVSRVPAIYDEFGRLYFSSDVKRGEKIRLSYGNPKEILRQTWEYSEEMRKFDPQANMNFVCGARRVFLNADSCAEIKDYTRINPQAVSYYGSGEIFKHKGQGGMLATAFVAVGFREGEARQVEEVADTVTTTSKTHRLIIPLANRLAAFLDATTRELKESNKKFKEAALEADAANKAKSQFLSNMSHEIRTPINAILGMNEMILRESSSPTILEYAENIRTAGNTLLGLVNDILDFSKIEAGKMEIIPVEYAISSVLNDLVNMIQARAAKKSLAFHVNADPNLPSVLFGDEIRIKQVVTNILTNAVKYTEHGSVTLIVKCHKISDDVIKIFFAVKDTGIGIKAEDIKKLFSAFERIEEKRNRTIEGTGLGMNITQRLLSMMNSELQVNSVYGEGSEFSFEIEQKVVNWHPLGNFEESYRHSLNQHKKYREKFTAPDAKILVVDDTVMNLTVVKGLLKQTKIKIDTADSGYECLGLVAKNHYDIIFLDHRMPGIDGIETLQRMKDMHNNLNHETPVISLTANAISGARKQYIDAGFQDYLTKPIDSAKLEAMLIDYLPKDKVNILGDDDDVEEVVAEETNLPEWLNTVDGISVADGLKNCGDVDSYLDALTVFAQSVISGAKEIANFCKNADWKNYTTKVHALKSSARVIGANELSDRARRLEDAGNSGYINEIKDSTDGLLELYISFADKLAPLLKVDEDDESKPLIEDDALAEAYETIAEVTDSFDYDTLMFVIQSLDDYRLPDAESEKFNLIKVAASKPDWEELRKLVG